MSLGTWSWQHNALFRIQGCGGDNTCDGVDDETMASLPRSNNASSCHVLCAQVLATLLGIQTKIADPKLFIQLWWVGGWV